MIVLPRAIWYAWTGETYYVLCDALIGCEPLLLLMAWDYHKQGDQILCVDDILLRDDAAEVSDGQAACLLPRDLTQLASLLIVLTSPHLKDVDSITFHVQIAARLSSCALTIQMRGLLCHRVRALGRCYTGSLYTVCPQASYP